MTAPLNILKLEEKHETAVLRAYYEDVARDTLRILGHRKLLIAVILLVALSLTLISLLLIGPRYSAEAVIQLNFIREEPTVGAKSQPIATLDAVALVDSAARVIRSRATASAVVARLGLDKDPDFARESISWRVLSSVRRALGLKVVPPPPRDLAVTQVMRKINVTNDPRSYSISVSVTTGDPERATILANAVALEYLRGQILQQLTDAQAALERELAQLSWVYGVRHPNYVLGRARLENLQARLATLRDGSRANDGVELAMGQSFLPAEKLMVPSGPNIPLVLGGAIGAALAVAIWLALWLGREQPSGCTESKPVASGPQDQHATGYGNYQHATGYGNRVDSTSDGALHRDEAETIHSQAEALTPVVTEKRGESSRACRGKTNAEPEQAVATPRASAYRVTVSAAQREVLERVVRARSTPQQLALRARIILHAADDVHVRLSARELGVSPKTVRYWRKRWRLTTERQPVSERLADAPRLGAPATFTREQICALVAITCEKPSENERLISHWSQGKIADEAMQNRLLTSSSDASQTASEKVADLKPHGVQ
jgi:capsular polysaccharide biosynthesis protein/transposase-like protein